MVDFEKLKNQVSYFEVSGYPEDSIDNAIKSAIASAQDEIENNHDKEVILNENWNESAGTLAVALQLFIYQNDAGTRTFTSPNNTYTVYLIDIKSEKDEYESIWFTARVKVEISD